MRFVRGILVALLVAPALVVVGATQALACSCVPARSDAKAVGEFAAVFSGTVVETEPDGDYAADWTFAVDTVYKGNVEERTVVGSGTQGTACGLVFKEEKRYAVFAYRDDGNLNTNSCTNTRPLNEGKELDLEPIAAFEPPPPFDGGASEQWSPWAIGSFGIVVLVALVSVGVFVAGGRAKTKNPGGPGTPEGPPS